MTQESQDSEQYQLLDEITEEQGYYCLLVDWFELQFIFVHKCCIFPFPRRCRGGRGGGRKWWQLIGWLWCGWYWQSVGWRSVTEGTGKKETERRGCWCGSYQNCSHRLVSYVMDFIFETQQNYSSKGIIQYPNSEILFGLLTKFRRTDELTKYLSCFSKLTDVLWFDFQM